ncbi:hypothetical protein AMS68_003309 [Peltaster fructicola]|uniref:Inner centromere protein ARK-binding domain-containing protein n=1 Tax=Peltaster fructicola TaxID=286661 RepID=A0A6H0XSP8_9PEZI|nr:hypothetical protein AMS68_003309 [Peltaster fructicola]
MAFFGIFKKNNSTESAQAEKQPKPSIRDLQARAFDRWAADGSVEPKARRVSHFEEERARRHSQENSVLCITAPPSGNDHRVFQHSQPVLQHLQSCVIPSDHYILVRKGIVYNQDKHTNFNNMASSTQTRHALASYEWIKDERSQASDETAKHIEDFSYSVTHELEWLNEKMAEVFSADPKTLTDIFKTPGRLRAKTPRTAKKLAVASPRVPLGDIFAPNARSPPATQLISAIDYAPSLRAESNAENWEPDSKAVSRSKSPQRVGQPGNTDSGYHGMTEDETDNERHSQIQHELQNQIKAPTKDINTDDTAQSGEDSFSSAPENIDARKLATEDSRPVETVIATDTYDDSPMSDTEEPERTSNRKSSFNFSSLPAREPLLAKKSLGARQSHLDGQSQASLGGKTAQKSAEVAVPGEPHKSTTQLLHERITMLGQARQAKTIPKSVHYPELPSDSTSAAQPEPVETLPPPPATSTSTASESVRPQSAYFDQPARPLSAHNDQSARPISMISLSTTAEHNTPVGSPASKKQYDGPLSASKNRLMSVLKSARSIFASSASASAAAKLEAHSTTPQRPSPTRDISYESKNESVMNMPGALQSDHSLARTMSRPLSIISMSPSRKTRSSNESARKREKELKAQQKAEDELERARQKEQAKAMKEAEQRAKAEAAEMARREAEAQKVAKAQEKETKSALPLAGKLRSVGKPVRLVNNPKDKPAPVNVKTASQYQTDTTQPRPTSSMRPSSVQGTIKVSTLQSTKSGARALEAAARKKELEEKEKARRQQQKAELERKRAAARAEDERKVADAQRVAQETKMAVLKQAEKVAEAKRRELQKLEQQRVEAQRQQEEADRLKAAHELAEAIARERAQQQAQIRNDVTGTIRQLGQKSADTSRPAIQTNPAKPAKRPLADSEESSQARPGPAYQQNEGKRRKTDELEEANQRTSVMAPPKRPSTMRKVRVLHHITIVTDHEQETLTRFPTGYAQAPPAANPPATLFKTTVSSQHQSQHLRPAPTHPSQTVQMSNARIPFADSSKPNVAAPSGYPEHNGKFKTPVRPAQGTAKSAAKSSPMYPNGDSIALPEIATDSEDEDDDDDDNAGFRNASWAASPALRDLLAQQQFVDPETVFGPIGELKMEEVFKNGKNPERLKKFRDRGSSAAWIQNGDAVTSAEKRRNMELIERVAREGGWRYEPGL